jgi:hypothetical protein
MSIINLKAAISCDGCGDHFRVWIDTAANIPDGWDLCDLITDQVRGGHGEDMKGNHFGIAGSCSVQAGLHLCPKCTKAVDASVPEDGDREPTEEEVKRALAGMEGKP